MKLTKRQKQAITRWVEQIAINDDGVLLVLDTIQQQIMDDHEAPFMTHAAASAAYELLDCFAE